MIQRYISKISGPLLDRIDIHIDVPAVNYKEMRSTNEPESSRENPRTGDSRPPGSAGALLVGETKALLQRADVAAEYS